MKNILLHALKFFVFMFLVIEVIPYLSEGGNLVEIGLQTIVIALFSIAIAIVNDKKRK